MTCYIKKTLFLIFLLPQGAWALETTTAIGWSSISFLNAPTRVEQKQQYPGVFLKYQLDHQIEKQQWWADLFFRFDAYDSQRTHFDIRELLFSHYADNWETHIGIGKEFWGVTEAHHLIDVINQVDSIELLDDESRLGQPLLKFTTAQDWGKIDFLWLPYFREREFGGGASRLQSPDVVHNTPRYQHPRGRKHRDFALRYSHFFGNIDLGLSYFQGTQREPLFAIEATDTNPTMLRPIYVQTRQIGVDLQYSYDNLLLKFEGVSRQSHDETYTNKNTTAFVTGFEYTLGGAFGSVYDLGILSEFLYDEWRETSPFNKDLMYGLRLALNNIASTEFLLTNIMDLDDHTTASFGQVSHRISDQSTFEAKITFLSNTDDNNLMAINDNNDLITLRWEYFP